MMGDALMTIAAVSLSVALCAFVAAGGTWVRDVWRRSKRG